MDYLWKCHFEQTETPTINMINEWKEHEVAIPSWN